MRDTAESVLRARSTVTELSAGSPKEESVKGILGRKVGMTQIYKQDGTVVPVTVVEAGPCFADHRWPIRWLSGVQLGLVPRRPSI